MHILYLVVDEKTENKSIPEKKWKTKKEKTTIIWAISRNIKMVLQCVLFEDLFQSHKIPRVFGFCCFQNFRCLSLVELLEILEVSSFWVVGVKMEHNYSISWKRKTFRLCCTIGFVWDIFFLSVLNTIQSLVLSLSSLHSFMKMAPFSICLKL